MKSLFLLLISGGFLAFISLSPLLLQDNDSTKMEIENKNKAKNVLGAELEPCCFEPKTGWYRDGFCNTNSRDLGDHVVCAVLTDDFLNHSFKCGNDLINPKPQYSFPGLKAGDKWCLCISRWKEAMMAGVAPPVILQSTHIKTLEIVSLEDLKKHEAK